MLYDGKRMYHRIKQETEIRKLDFTPKIHEICFPRTLPACASGCSWTTVLLLPDRAGCNEKLASDFSKCACGKTDGDAASPNKKYSKIPCGDSQTAQLSSQRPRVAEGSDPENETTENNYNANGRRRGGGGPAKLRALFCKIEEESKMTRAAQSYPQFGNPILRSSRLQIYWHFANTVIMREISIDSFSRQFWWKFNHISWSSIENIKCFCDLLNLKNFLTFPGIWQVR